MITAALLLEKGQFKQLCEDNNYDKEMVVTQLIGNDLEIKFDYWDTDSIVHCDPFSMNEDEVNVVIDCSYGHKEWYWNLDNAQELLYGDNNHTVILVNLEGAE